MMPESIRAYIYCNHEPVSEKPVKISFDDRIEYWHWVARECLYYRRDRAEYANLRYTGHQLGFSYAETRPYEKIGDEDRKNYNLYILCEQIESFGETTGILAYLWIQDAHGKRVLVPCGRVFIEEQAYVLDLFQAQAGQRITGLDLELKLISVYAGNDLFKISEVSPHLTVKELGVSHIVFRCEASGGIMEHTGHHAAEVEQALLITLMIMWPGAEEEHIYPLSEISLDDKLDWSTERLKEWLIGMYVPMEFRERLSMSLWKGDIIDKLHPVEVSPYVQLPALNQELLWVRMSKN
jgi:hypothetical protein